MILAKTFKGRGVSFAEDKEGWHGKAFKAGEEADRAVGELEATLKPVAADAIAVLRASIPKPTVEDPAPKPRPAIPPPAYKLGDLVATREAYGTALARIGAIDDRIVALDADVGNSTFSDRFEKVAPERFFQHYIAEQVMVGAAMGLAARGAIPFPSTFACFLTRAYDFIRMAAISNLNIKLAGSHAGVSIGEDGPSQMALEDLAMTRAEPNFTVLYPCEAVSAERCVELAAYQPGPVYIRTSRPKTPVTYGPNEVFTVGGSKVLRQSAADAATVVGVGVTVFEALHAFDALAKDGIAIRVIDAYSVQPIDADTLTAAARATSGRVVTVEDHYAAGGLGDAVAGGDCAGRLRGAPARRARDSAQRQARGTAGALRRGRRQHRRGGQGASLLDDGRQPQRHGGHRERTERLDLAGNAANKPQSKTNSVRLSVFSVSLWFGTVRHRAPYFTNTARFAVLREHLVEVLDDLVAPLEDRLGAVEEPLAEARLDRGLVERLELLVELLVDLGHRKRHRHRRGERARVVDEDQVPRLVHQQVALVAVDVGRQVVPHALPVDLLVPRGHVRRLGGVAVPQQRAVLHPELRRAGDSPSCLRSTVGGTMPMPMSLSSS